MTLWLVLGGVLILIVWATKLVFDLGTAGPVIATLGILLALLAIWGLRILLARRAARRLEAALSAQAAAQASGARPERRAEIEELQKKLQAGIAAIKGSKGAGGKRGAAALYHLPWYMIIGPPGAGKTTALRQSGIVFPTGASDSLRGVGGTRNCDWWFTNEAVLLDTAGRYTTESDDAAEWQAFLAFLLRYRQNRPINGVIIAISISELLDAKEPEIEATGKKLRARIDEVITQLHMVVPVYVLFTKIDLIAGFRELFGDLKKSDRAQAWGATLKLDDARADPGKAFEAEFDLLLGRLHGRALQRCVRERSREAREQLYQFPLEFAELKANLSSLLSVTFAPNTFQSTPIFRGFYFTSGTQEGRPLDRVLERMSAAMGIRGRTGAAAGEAGPAPAAVIEPKSYFLHDLFINVIFRDGDLGVRSQAEVRRQRLFKLAIAGATLALAALLCLPALTSYANNRDFLEQAARHSKLSASFAWDDDTKLSKKLSLLDPSLRQLREHDHMNDEGVPWGMGWWMYRADKVQKPTMRVYVAQLQRGFVEPCRRALASQLATANPDKYVQVRTMLKQYLMLQDVEHLDVDWAAGRYTQLWVEQMKSQSDVTDAELKELMRPHVRYYFELLKRGKVRPVGLDEPLIERVRAALQSVPVDQRFYAMIVDSVKDLRIDEAGEPSIANMMVPPVQLPMIFPDRPDVLKHFRSRSVLQKRGYTEVEGPYTDKGYYIVVKQLEGAEELLRSEAWVVAPTKDETADKVVGHVLAVKTRYEGQYIEQWKAFFADILVATPQTADEAIELYASIALIEYPHRRLLHVLDDHTQFRNANPLEGNDAIAREANRRFNQKLNMYTSGIVINFDLRELGKKMDRVPAFFAGAKNDGPIQFERPPKRGAGGQGDSKVFKYTEIVRKLSEKIEIARSKPREPGAGPFSLLELNDELEKARAEAAALLVGLDSAAVLMLKPLLMPPLSFGVRPEVAPPAASTPASPMQGR